MLELNLSPQYLQVSATDAYINGFTKSLNDFLVKNFCRAEV